MGSNSKDLSSLCRICLNNNAQIPLFGDGICKNEKKNSLEKLSSWLGEKIIDDVGYPKNICSNCDDTINVVYEFVEKIKETNLILKDGFVVVKNEKVEEEESENDDYLPDEDNYIDIETDIPIKKETLEILGNLQCTVKLVKLPDIKISDTQKTSKGKRACGSKNKAVKRTNPIASSLLEGCFVWSGEEWCLSSAMKDGKSIESKVLATKMGKGCRTIKIPKERKKRIGVKKSNKEKLCDVCGDVFKTEYYLKLHRIKKHFPKKCPCPHCPKVSTSEFYLKRHIARIHTKNRNFVCSSCGKKFAFLNEVNQHFRRVHDKRVKKKSFECHCGKSYNCSKSLIIHQRSVHTGERPAICTICDSAFFHEDYLKEHMRLHTGETPFACPICGRGYAQRGNMKSHLRNHRISDLDDMTLKKIRPSYLKYMRP